MPNVNLLFRLFLGAPVRLLHGKPLCAEAGRERLLAQVELRERMLIRTVPRTVPDYVRDVEAERAGVRLALVIALP